MSHLLETESKFDKNLVLSRILSLDDYRIITSDTYKHYKVTDKVVCFFNGLDWHIILLEDMLAYPILNFNFTSVSDNITYVNSLVVCPITLRSMIYKGRIQIQDIINDRLFLLNKDTEDEFFMDLPYTGHYDSSGKEKKIKSQVKRHEVKILTLRDSFMFLLDVKYIVVNESKKKHQSILYEGYYINRYTYEGLPIYTSYHPKTIVYMVQYYSHNTKNYRYTVIVGKDINKDSITGYNYKASGLWAFINKHLKEFTEKRAYIYPIFWFMIDKLYKDQDVKMILIT
jgi:hypothetical protein